MLRSRLAVGRAQARQHPTSQPRAAFTPRPAGSLRRGGEGRGGREHRQLCQLGGNRHPNWGCVPQPLLARSPAPRWICCFCSPSIFPISLSLLTHTLWVSPSYLKRSAGAGGIGMGTSTRTHHHHPTEKRALGACGVSFSLGVFVEGRRVQRQGDENLKKIKAPIKLQHPPQSQ